MLIPASSFFDYETGVTPKTPFNEVVKNIFIEFDKYPWFDSIYVDIHKNEQNIFVIKCRYKIDVDQFPDRHDAYQIKYTWEGKRDLTIQEACEKFIERYGKENWFNSIEIINNEYLSVTINGRKNKRFDFYENYPIQYGIKSKLEEN